MAFKYLIFDFDGTLADTNEGIVRSYQETFRCNGWPVPTREKITSSIGLALKDAFKLINGELTEDALEEFRLSYRSLFREIAYPLIDAFPGTKETLETLKREGYRMSIATSRSHVSLEDLARQIGVIDYFESLVGAEDVEHHKPAPDLVNAIMEKYKLDPKEVLVIGDAVFDILMGHGAGCKACAAAWGNQTREQLSSVNPEFIISDIRELPDLLKSL